MASGILSLLDLCDVQSDKCIEVYSLNGTKFMLKIAIGHKSYLFCIKIHILYAIEATEAL